VAFEVKPNTGSLFKNEDKQTDRHPDFNGSIDVNGEPFWLNGWSKTSKNGKRYLSLSIKPKAAPPEAKKPEFDDSIEF
jgi:uncharacterized protein (DUF736 family)